MRGPSDRFGGSVAYVRLNNDVCSDLVIASRSVAILLACLAVVLLAGLLVSTWVIRFIALPLYSLSRLLVG